MELNESQLQGYWEMMDDQIIRNMEPIKPQQENKLYALAPQNFWEITPRNLDRKARIEYIAQWKDWAFYAKKLGLHIPGDLKAEFQRVLSKGLRPSLELQCHLENQDG